MSDNTAINVTSENLMTPEGYAEMKRELEHLTMVKRPEIAERIRESLSHGEFSEDNSELDEVKFEQAIVESRIADLKAVFSNVRVLEESEIPTDRVGIGSFVTLRDDVYDEEFRVRLVGTIEADPEKDYISPESPLGAALQGREKGEVFEFETPGGRLTYKVLEISRA